MKKFVLLGLLCATGAYSNAQNLNWAFNVGGTTFDSVNVVKEHNGHLFCAGSYSGNSNNVEFDPIGPGQGAFNNTTSGFLTNYNPNGTLNWVLPVYSPNGSESSDIVVENGTVLYAGTFNGGNIGLDYLGGSGFHSVNPIENGFVGQFDENTGSVIWSTAIGVTGGASANGVSYDQNGDVFVGGYCGDQGQGIDMDAVATGSQFPTGLIGPFSIQGYVAKYDVGTGAGEFQWGIALGGDGSEVIDVVADGAGDVYVLGKASPTNSGNIDPAGFGFNVGGSGNENMFLAKYNGGSGTMIWGTELGGTSDEFGVAIGLYGPFVYIVGTTNSTSWNANPLGTAINVSSNGGVDGFFASYSGSTGDGTYARTFGGTGDDVIHGASNDDSKLAITGSFDGTIDLDPASSSPVFNSNGGTDCFVGQYELTSGNYTNGFTIGGTANEFGTGAHHSNSDNVFVVGTSHGTIDIDGDGNDEVQTNGIADVFISSFCIAPAVTHPAPSALCEGDQAITLSGGSPSGGNYSGIGVIGGNFYPLLTGPGSYNLNYEYTAPNGCTVNVPFNMVVNPEPSIVFGNLDVACINEDPIQLNQALPTGGNYTGQGITNGVLDPVDAGIGLHLVTYSYTDGNGCAAEAYQTQEVAEIPSITVSTTDSDCGQDNGQAIASSTGGEAPYNYYWSSGANASVADNLAGGLYVINVTDGNNCSNFEVVTISDLNGPSIAVDNITDVTCYGDDNGDISTTISGGSGNLSILWSNGETTDDITQLSAGNYEISVTDTAGCEATMSITVDQPQPLSIDTTITLANCATNDGSITVTGQGGNGSYSYEWLTTGSSGPTDSNLAVGLYELELTDGQGCVDTFYLTMNESGGPVITIDQIDPASCGNLDGNILTSITGNGTIGYTWLDESGSTVGTLEDLNGVDVGEYTIIATDQAGCSSSSFAEVMPFLPENVEICLVTVDTLTGTNLVVWEKPVSTGIDHFRIYKEGSVSGLYELIDTIHYNSLSQYTDPVSNPQIRSWRYKIAAVDACGNEGDISPRHKTIHLTSSYGISNEINLSWDHYQGFLYSTYNVWRWSDIDGWQQLTSIPGNLSSYSDLNPPVGASAIRYMVEATPNVPCVSTRANHNTTRSNRTQPIAGPSGNPDGIAEGVLRFRAYPNPTSDYMKLEFSESLSGTLVLLDLTGKTLEIIPINSAQSAEINLQGYASGIYQLVLRSGERVHTLKVHKTN